MAQVAGKTFGVPAALAERIAVYSDNAAKQLQLDRQCQAHQRQRRIRTQQLEHHASDIDHVLLNKTAIVLPAVPLTGDCTTAASTVLNMQLHCQLACFLKCPCDREGLTAAYDSKCQKQCAAQQAEEQGKAWLSSSMRNGACT